MSKALKAALAARCGAGNLMSVVAKNAAGIDPLEYKVLVRPVEVDQKTRGGIILPDETKERDQHAAMEGEVIAISPLAFKYEDDAPRPHVGATVIFARYSGINVTGKDGVAYRLMNDKDVVAVREAR